MGLQQFIPLTQSLLVFAARTYGDLSSQPGNPGLIGAGVGLGLLSLEIALPNFYPPHMDMGPAHSASPPFLPVWMDVVSLILHLSDFHLTQFLTVLSNGHSIIYS